MYHYAANYVFDGCQLIKNAFVSLDANEKIVYVSKENEALVEKPRMSFYNGIICPAFINSHCHLELSSVDNSTHKDIGLTDFIRSVISNSRKKHDIKEISNRDKQMFENGISFVGDISNTDISIEAKLKSKIKYHSFIELSGINDDSVEDKMKYARALSAEFSNSGLSNSISAHSFYSISQKLFEHITKAANESTQSIHFLESNQEQDWFYYDKGELKDFLNSINPNYKALFTNEEEIIALLSKYRAAKSVILVHNTALSKPINNLVDNVFYCLCPNSNVFLHNVLPKSEFVKSVIAKSIVGTDSIASNTNLCVLSELKTLAEAYDFISLIELLKMATSNAAKAFSEDNNYGFLNIGMSPGLILLENVDLIELKLQKNSIIRRLL